MGYYTGSGVVTSGSSSISTNDSIYDGSNTYARQTLTTTTETTKAGVQLSTAKAATASSTLKCANLTVSSLKWPSPNAYESTTNSTYSRIGDSNLYTLVTVTVVNQKRMCVKTGTGEGALTNGSWAT